MDWQRGVAVAAQFSQAATSLALSMVAVRSLDSAQFGQYLLVTSTIIIATGATTGLVGDSLTVLDRSEPTMRRTLLLGGIAAGLLAATVVGLMAGLLGWLAWGVAMIAGVATAAFVLEDLVRRLLMANRRFPAVIATDAVYALGAGATLAAAVGMGGIGLATMFVAIAVGQLVAIVAGLALLPGGERHLPRLRGPLLIRQLLGFGGWRALHLTIGPLKLWTARLIVSAISGFAAVGLLEANRLVMAPLMLAIQGASSAILVSQAAQLRQSPRIARRQADRDAATLAALASAATVALLVSRTPVASVILGSTALVDPVVLAGWGLVAVGMALNVPYANLAAAAGSPRAALLMRLLDMALMVVAMGALIAGLPEATWYRWVPATIGALSCALALLQRRVARTCTLPLPEPEPGQAGPHPRGA